jgi:hypothetical protein
MLFKIKFLFHNLSHYIRLTAGTKFGIGGHMLTFERNTLATCEWNVRRIQLSSRCFMFTNLLYGNMSK